MGELFGERNEKKYFRKAGIVPENSSEDINDKDDDDGNIPLAE